MNVGRPMPPLVRKLIIPPGRAAWVWFFIAIAAIVWGAAWLAGGQFVLILGLFLLALNVLYRGLRLAGCIALAARYRQPIPRRPGLFGHPLASTFVLLALGLVLYFELPLKLSIACARPVVYRMWAVDPAPMDAGFRDHFVGPLWADRVEINPNYVWLYFDWAGSLNFNPETGDVVIMRMPLAEGLWRVVHGYWRRGY